MQCRFLQSVGISFWRLKVRHLLRKIRLKDSLCPRTHGHIRRSGLSFLIWVVGAASDAAFSVRSVEDGAGPRNKIWQCVLVHVAEPCNLSFCCSAQHVGAHMCCFLECVRELVVPLFQMNTLTASPSKIVVPLRKMNLYNYIISPKHFLVLELTCHSLLKSSDAHI